MNNYKITTLTDIHNDLLIVEVNDLNGNNFFYLTYNEKTAELKVNFHSKGDDVSFQIDEFQKLIEELKLKLKGWAQDVADQN